jgi:hypothetical protein
MLTAAQNPTTPGGAPKVRTGRTPTPKPVELKGPRWSETRAIAAMARSFA